MRAELNQIDTEAACLSVLDLHDFSLGQDFALFERQAIYPYKPAVVFCKVPAQDILSIQSLETQGFRFADFQLTLRHRIRNVFELRHYRYHWQRVTTDADLDAALELAGTIFEHDRFYTDSEFGPAVSSRRYRAYVRKSYQQPNERVYVMKANDTGEVVSFGTVRCLNSKEMRLLIGGVANDLKRSGIGVIHDYVGIRTYYDEGIRVLHTVVSGTNYPIMNLEIAHLGFKIERSHVVLKKRYV